MADLKPCPFCGDHEVELALSSVPSASTGGMKAAVFCNSCFCEGPTADFASMAIARWNERTQPGEAT